MYHTSYKEASGYHKDSYDLCESIWLIYCHNHLSCLVERSNKIFISFVTNHLSGDRNQPYKSCFVILSTFS